MSSPATTTLSPTLPLRPSIFVLLAEDQLATTLRNAVHFVLKFIVNKYPQSWLARQFGDSTITTGSFATIDELYLVIDLFIQWSYLHRWNGTFTEQFFSLARFSTYATNSSTNNDIQWQKLSNREIVASLLFVSVAPYMWRKLSAHVQQLQELRQVLIEQQQNNKSEALYHFTITDRALLNYLPQLQKLYQMLKICNWISYATSNSPKHCPNVSLWLLGRMQLGYYSPPVFDNSTLSIHKSIAHPLSYWLTTCFDLALKSGAFLVQFAEYWYSQTDVRTKAEISSSSTTTLLPPPKPHLSVSTSISSQLCPLCLRRQINPTALATSGYVFCYLCIRDHIVQHRRCPVTGFACTLDQLIRIFDEHEEQEHETEAKNIEVDRSKVDETDDENEETNEFNFDSNWFQA